VCVCHSTDVEPWHNAGVLSAGVLPASGQLPPIRCSALVLIVPVPDRKVWVSWIDAADAKPGTINSGFRYGQEIAIVCDPKGGLFALSNKMPPTGQPTTFAKFGEKGTVVEPITLTEFSTKTGKQVGTWCPSPVGRLLIGRLTSPSDIPVFPVRKQGGSVQVQINVNAKAQFESKYWRGVLDAQGKVDGGYY